MRTLIVPAIVLMFLASCQEEEVMFEEYRDMPSNIWKAEDVVSFHVEVSDTINPYDIFINFRNTTDYGWNNMFIFMTVTDPYGLTERDTLELRVAEDDGRWTGRESGSLVHNNFFYKQVTFPHGGTYNFELQHGMRDTELDEIPAVGISIKSPKGEE